jgi:hypothetical protein
MLNYSLNFPLSLLVLGWELVLCEGRHREGGMSRFVEVSRLEGPVAICDSGRRVGVVKCVGVVQTVSLSGRF